MNRSIIVVGLLGLFSAFALAGDSRDYPSYATSYNYSLYNGLDPRVFVTSNDTMITVGLIPFAIGAAISIGLLVLLIVPFLIPLGGDSGDYTGYGATGVAGGSSYTAYSRSFNPYAIDWETFTILDWIAIAEETWKKFEPGNLDCQKRLICEVHQNIPRFGIIAKKMVDVFSYLQFAEVLRLPEEVKSLIEDYLEAADRGRSMKKDCGEIYSTCDFSVKKMVDKVSHNEI